jgi:dihydroxyacetone kinase-like protein
MEPSMLGTTDIASALVALADDLEARSEELRQLDAAIGDGDLGITTQLGSQAIRQFLGSSTETDVGQLLARCGMSINKASPSTFGTLLASAFVAAGKAVKGKERVGTDDLVRMGEAAIDGIKKRGHAEVGDKTILDCLVPAVDKLKAEVESNSDLASALQAAVEAADKGLQSTVNMVSKHGRASWHRENTIGVQDAGATAMYYMIESFVRCLQRQPRV